MYLSYKYEWWCTCGNKELGGVCNQSVDKCPFNVLFPGQPGKPAPEW